MVLVPLALLGSLPAMLSLFLALFARFLASFEVYLVSKMVIVTNIAPDSFHLELITHGFRCRRRERPKVVGVRYPVHGH